MRKNLFWFALGFILAVLLARSAAPVEAQNPAVMLGMASGTATPISVSATGSVSVQLQ